MRCRRCARTVHFAGRGWRRDESRDVIPGEARDSTRSRTRKTTLLKASEIGREILYPAKTATVFIALLSFFLLLEFAAFGGLYGLLLAFLVLPALLRYLMVVLEARARGVDPGPPGVDMFLLFERPWTLFSVFHLAVIIYSIYLARSISDDAATLVVGLLLIALTPASLAVLALTRSPLASLNPRAVGGLIIRCGTNYWLIPLFLLAALSLLGWLNRLPVSDFFTEFVAIYLLFAAFALTGGALRPFDLHREVGIPEPLVPDADVVAGQLVHERHKVLSHAYGFVSRGNREGGLAHIHAWLAEDPDPDSAWPWFTAQMLRWEQSAAALPLARQYLHRLLRCGEQAAAVKLMLRCRLVDAAFQPLPEDTAALLDAAVHCRNEDLIRYLRA